MNGEDDYHRVGPKLTQEQADTRSPTLLRIVRQAFPNYTEFNIVEGEANKRGNDTSVGMPYGPPVTIDWKFRKVVYEDIALEYGHTDGFAPGWAADPGKQNDLIGYVFKPIATCWLMPRLEVLNAWERYKDEWLDGRFFIVRAPNRTYYTLSVAVPFDVTKQTIGGIRIATPTTLEIVKHPSPYFNFEREYCYCGRLSCAEHPHDK